MFNSLSPCRAAAVEVSCHHLSLDKGLLQSNVTPLALLACRNGDTDLNVMLGLLTSGAYDALILDTPVLQYVVGTDDTCTLFLVGDPFHYFSVGLGFPVGTNDSVLTSWSTAMVRQQVSAIVNGRVPARRYDPRSSVTWHDAIRRCKLIH